MCLRCYQVAYHFAALCILGNSSVAPACHDVLSDCGVANKTTGICSSQQYGRQMCAEFCGFCSIGKNIHEQVVFAIPLKNEHHICERFNVFKSISISQKTTTTSYLHILRSCRGNL